MVFSANNELFLYLCDIKANYTRYEREYYWQGD